MHILHTECSLYISKGPDKESLFNSQSFLQM